MNDLAHLFLARPDPLSRMGNLLGDFRRGMDETVYPEPVRAGLANHRAVDAFTDAHPRVAEARRRFSRARRRFAGVALDVAFDHFLIQHWERFSGQSLDEFVEEVYRDLRDSEPEMPRGMRSELARRREADWLRRYACLDTVGAVLDRMAARVRFQNGFGGIIGEIKARQSELEADFLAFFPELRAEVERLALEGQSGRSS
jgi:acyl carrier protein phosphodiesterase